MKSQMIAALMIVPVLAGCEGSSAEDTAPMKTATYYTQHLAEAQEVAGRCKLLDEHKQRTLSVGDYQEWQISNEGVNCQTALSVSEAASLREFVLKQSKPQAPTAAPKATPPSSSVPVQQERTEQKIISAQTLAPV
ncbi:hypothetical protein GTP45_11355 [Pseudoduganella sp. FT55W]|uniref:Lipoprotein n=1 Tax=Duganella rivi TaxID=2666083 RepID=A0A7X4GPT0_9BURK|nr:hypothetical protein [Duganella rivi]MYM67425.1 hypothetical protein [Duganella rivi]